MASPAAAPRHGPGRRAAGSLGRVLRSRVALFVGFTFAVMADPVSSVAYAIEAALRALHGDLGLLLATMTLVIVIIGVVVINYQQIVARYPHGGGAAAAAAEAFGFGWAFLPLGALLVDFVLTIAISSAAAASAIIAFDPGLAGDRIVIGLVLLAAVAAVTFLGHAGRLVFATMTLAFLAVATVLLAIALPEAVTSPVAGQAPAAASGGTGGPWSLGSALAIALAFPVAMALATGVEAPSSAIAQLGQLDDEGRRAFGRWTLWVTLGTVGLLTLGLSFAIVRLDIGVPPADSTLLAQLARRAGPPIVFGLFQATSAVLLLAAASSSFQAGPGLLKALARGARRPGVLPDAFGQTNRHHTPVLGVLVCMVGAAAMVIAAEGRDQELVLFYAVAVFVSFLAGLGAMARIHLAEGRRRALVLDLIGTALVAFTLTANLARGYPIVSLVAALVAAWVLHRMWTRAGRPTGVRIEIEEEPALIASGGEPEPVPAAP